MTNNTIHITYTDAIAAEPSQIESDKNPRSKLGRGPGQENLTKLAAMHLRKLCMCVWLFFWGVQFSRELARLYEYSY